MPWKPRPPCPRCGVVGCKDKTHDRYWRARQKRPVPNSEKERRAAVVKEYKRTHGWQAPGGKWVAPCPRCHRVVSDMTAEHVVPFALSGREDGPLSVLCRSCNSRGGAVIVNRGRQRSS